MLKSLDLWPMNITKYFFSFPLNPKNELKFLKQDLEKTDDFKETALWLFFIYSGLVFFKAFGYSIFKGEVIDFDLLTLIDSSLYDYFASIFIFLGITIAIKIFAKNVIADNIDNYKLFSLVIIGTGLVTFLFNLIIGFIMPYIYSSLSYYVVGALKPLLIAFFLFLSLSADEKFIPTSNEIKENPNGYFILSGIIYGVGFIVSSFLGMAYSMFYLF